MASSPFTAPSRSCAAPFCQAQRVRLDSLDITPTPSLMNAVSTPMFSRYSTTSSLSTPPTLSPSPSQSNLKPLEAPWVNDKLLPFLRFAFSHTISYDYNFMPHVFAAESWARSNPCVAPENEDIMFERIFMAVVHRHLQTDPEMTPYVNSITPLTRYLVFRAISKGPYELLGCDWVGSKEWVEEMSRRYPANGRRDETVRTTRDLMSAGLLDGLDDGDLGSDVWIVRVG